MKIAFVHYHLKTGGVTTVILQQINAIRQVCDVLILTGEPPETDMQVDVTHVPGLGYTIDESETPNPETIAGSIVRAIQDKWKDGCDILHIHNPLLSKNRVFLKIIKSLQKHPMKLFLQVHDFAEDGRPLSYFPEEYPGDCHYGVINSRDYTFLLASGLKKEGLHQIRNMVRSFDDEKKTAIEDSILYPVRAIRRKNIGEAILLSLFFKHRETLAITLPPNSPADIESYAGWKQFVAESGLKVAFDVGLRDDFTSLVSSSKYLITTSISEGFGFSFLEPWTAGKMLFGRKLTGICDDFEANGIGLDHLYSRLQVPIDWIDEIALHRKWESSVLKVCSQFDFEIKEQHMDSAFGAMTGDGNIDFGLLDEEFQKRVISGILADRENYQKLISLNPHLSYLGEISKENALIQHNEHSVETHYNEAIYRKMLLSTYEKIVRNMVRHRINKKELFSGFLNLENFSLLKWGDYIY